MFVVTLCVAFIGWYAYQARALQQIIEENIIPVQAKIVIQDQIASRKMHKYRLDKLWRDKAAARLEKEDGAIIHRYILNDDDYRVQLGLKLQEEAAEVDVAQALKNKKELAEEIADVLEVLDCIIAFNDLDMQEIKDIQQAKREKRGSFLAREFITIAEAADGSFLHNYYLQSPDRHQELID